MKQQTTSKPRYETPRVVPLGGIAIGIGQACTKPGSSASSNCNPGATAAGQQCKTGATALGDRCHTGLTAAAGGCSPGNTAGQTCNTGSAANLS